MNAARPRRRPRLHAKPKAGLDSIIQRLFLNISHQTVKCSTAAIPRQQKINLHLKSAAKNFSFYFWWIHFEPH